MSGHTPGPWVFAHRKCLDGMYRTQVFSGEHGHVADCAWTPKPCVNGCTETYREDNARLIAAAPDLLAALIGVLRVADRKTDEFDAARAAIAKATAQPAGEGET